MRNTEAYYSILPSPLSKTQASDQMVLARKTKWRLVPPKQLNTEWTALKMNEAGPALCTLHITLSNLFNIFMDCHNPKGLLVVHKYNLFSFHVTCINQASWLVNYGLSVLYKLPYSINYDSAWDGKPTHSSIICNHIYLLSSLNNKVWTANLGSDFPYL